MTRPEPAVKYSRLKRTHEKRFPFTREWNLSRFRGLPFLSNNDNNVNDNNSITNSNRSIFQLVNERDNKDEKRTNDIFFFQFSP